MFEKCHVSDIKTVCGQAHINANILSKLSGSNVDQSKNHHIKFMSIDLAPQHNWKLSSLQCMRAAQDIAHDNNSSKKAFQNGLIKLLGKISRQLHYWRLRLPSTSKVLYSVHPLSLNKSRHFNHQDITPAAI